MSLHRLLGGQGGSRCKGSESQAPYFSSQCLCCSQKKRKRRRDQRQGGPLRQMNNLGEWSLRGRGKQGGRSHAMKEVYITGSYLDVQRQEGRTRCSQDPHLGTWVHVVLFTTQEPMFGVGNSDGFLSDIVSEGVLNNQDNFFDVEKWQILKPKPLSLISSFIVLLVSPNSLKRSHLQFILFSSIKLFEVCSYIWCILFSLRALRVPDLTRKAP